MLLSQAVKGIEGVLVSDGRFDRIAFATEQEQPRFLTFLEREKFVSALDNQNITCVLITPELTGKIPSHIQGVFVCQYPKATLFEIHNALAKDEAYVGKPFNTIIGENCRISPLSHIDPDNVVVGNNVIIEPFAVIKGRVTIGDNVIIRSHAAIGCKGFSFSKDASGNNISVIDTAEIVIHNGVEIFEHVAISTGLFPWEKTEIGENTKIDTRCFVAHGTHIGKNTLLAAGSLCCGNCRIGDNVWLGASAVVSNRVCVGDDARVSIGAVVTKDVPAGMTVSGNFAIEHRRFMENLKESVKE